MLEKSSILMMLLITTASFVGMSIYQPANVSTQPQQIPEPQGLITRQQHESMAQIMADAQLLDRIMPQIIKRIDGKTLLQKLDGKTLATKVLPHLDISANVIRRDGPASVLNVQNVARDLGLTGAEPLSSAARCNSGEIAVSGGFSFSSDPEDSYISAEGLGENGWGAFALMKDNGQLKASVTCLTINVGLKDVQQPQQQPSLPPGGTPLKPLPNLR
jgi:hypothetical protein